MKQHARDTRTAPTRVRAYRLPWRIAPALGRDVFAGERRDFVADCRAMVRQMRPRPRVLGAEQIPTAGPFLLVANHYEGPGLWIGWAASLLTVAVARQRPDRAALHWLVIADMDRGRVEGWKKLLPGTGWAFHRVAAAWGMVPVPRPEQPAAVRATALRRLLRIAAPPPAGRGEPVAYFPEGEGDGFAGLRPIPPEAAGLPRLLARRGVPSLPAAVWQEDGRLIARFGPPWLPAAHEDAAALMGRIAALLPPALHGAYTPMTPHPLPSSGAQTAASVSVVQEAG